MAGRGPVGRDRRGTIAAPVRPVHYPDPCVSPTQDRPRFRLRVFDRCWPWRASVGEVMADAVASRNARRDLDDRVTYLDACANIQRDPPSPK